MKSITRVLSLSAAAPALPPAAFAADPILLKAPATPPAGR